MRFSPRQVSRQKPIIHPPRACQVVARNLAVEVSERPSPARTVVFLQARTTRAPRAGRYTRRPPCAGIRSSIPGGPLCLTRSPKERHNGPRSAKQAYRRGSSPTRTPAHLADRDPSPLVRAVFRLSTRKRSNQTRRCPGGRHPALNSG